MQKLYCTPQEENDYFCPAMKTARLEFSKEFSKDSKEYEEGLFFLLKKASPHSWQLLKVEAFCQIKTKHHRIKHCNFGQTCFWHPELDARSQEKLGAGSSDGSPIRVLHFFGFLLSVARTTGWKEIRFRSRRFGLKMTSLEFQKKPRLNQAQVGALRLHYITLPA